MHLMHRRAQRLIDLPLERLTQRLQGRFDSVAHGVIGGLHGLRDLLLDLLLERFAYGIERRRHLPLERIAQRIERWIELLLHRLGDLLAQRLQDRLNRLRDLLLQAANQRVR